MSVDAPTPGDVDERRAADESYTDQRRKAQILDAREKISEVERELVMAKATGEIDGDVYEQILGTYVRTYLELVEPLLNDESIPMADEIYTEYEFDPVVVEPPEEFVENTHDINHPDYERQEFEVVDGTPTASTFELNGILDIIENHGFEAGWKVQVRWIDRLDKPPRETLTEAKQKRVPAKTLKEAVRVVDTWLQNAGIGIELDSNRPFSNYTE